MTGDGRELVGDSPDEFSDVRLHASPEDAQSAALTDRSSARPTGIYYNAACSAPIYSVV